MKNFFSLREAKSPEQQAAIAIAKKKKGEYKEEMDPAVHVKDADGKFVVVDKDGKPVAKFSDKEEAIKYATAKHKELMKVDEALQEKLKVSDGIETWIKDFQDSDAPQFKGKDKEQRRKMAIAAFKDAEESIKENVEDDMPASPDEKSMAMKQAEFIMYVGREIGEHLESNKEFPEWMQNKLSALHQKAKDMHATLGAHGMNEEVENIMESLPKEKFLSAEAKLTAYAKKNGGIDKRDFLEIAKMCGQIGRINILQAGQVLAKLNRKIDGLDTDVREKVFEILKSVQLMESLELKEDFYTVTYRDKRGKVEAEKDFDSKSAAEKYAKLGNSRDKVGGTYTVTLVRDGGRGRMKEEVELEEKYSWNDVNDALKKANYMRGNPAHIDKVAAKFDYKSGKDKKFSLADLKKNLSAAGIDGAKQHDIMKHIKEEGGAGDEGTPELLKKYRKNTPMSESLEKAVKKIDSAGKNEDPIEIAAMLSGIELKDVARNEKKFLRMAKHSKKKEIFKAISDIQG